MSILIHRPDGPIVLGGHGRSPGRGSLAGARIGVLDNAKPNAGLLMTTVASEIAERSGARVTLVLDKNAAKPAPDEHIDRLIAEVDLVITGSAD